MKKIYVLGLGLLISLFFGCESNVVTKDESPIQNDVIIMKETEDDALYTIEGVIKAVNEENIILVTNEDEYVINLDEELIKMEKLITGLLIEVDYNGEIMESYPMQINGVDVFVESDQVIVEGVVSVVSADVSYIKVVDAENEEYVFETEVSENTVAVGQEVSFNISKNILIEHKMKLDDLILEQEDSGLITLDPREAVSGYIREFPMFILSEELMGETTLESVFAIALSENPSTGYSYKIRIDDFHFEMTGDGSNTGTLLGAPQMHYYGFRAIEAGEHQIIFDIMNPSGEIEETIEYTITVK